MVIWLHLNVVLETIVTIFFQTIFNNKTREDCLLSHQVLKNSSIDEHVTKLGTGLRIFDE